MEVVFLEGRRNGYTPEECGSTMTVGELIDFLMRRFDDETPIYINNDNGYTYGNITYSSFKIGDTDEE